MSSEVCTYGTFSPPQIISDLVEAKARARRLSVATLLLSGVSPEQFSIRVSEDGQVLQVTITWPNSLVDSNLLHRKWLQSKESDHIKTYHPNLIIFEQCSKTCRSRNSVGAEYTALVSLPLQV